MRTVWSFTFIVLLALASCKNDPVEVHAVTKKDSLPLMTTTNIDLLYTDSARLKAHLTAPLAEDYGGSIPKTFFTQGVFVRFYDEFEKENSSLKADYAEYSEKEQLMLAKKNVIVVNIKGEQLNTEKLIWDGKRQKIHTDAFVKITTADQVIMGNGLESDQTFTEYEIKDITGTIMLNEAEEGEE